MAGEEKRTEGEIPTNGPPASPAESPVTDGPALPHPTPPGDQKPAPPPEEDILFKLQVTIQDFFANNFATLGYILLAFLGVALVYGMYQSWQEHNADADFAAIADVDFKMPKPDPLSQMGLGPADNPGDAGRMKDLEVGAKLYEDIAASSSGAAAVTAWVRAADARERAKQPAERIRALEQARAAGGDSALGATAALALAGALLETPADSPDRAASTDRAVAVYAELSARTDFFGQEAAAARVRALAAAGKAEEAKAAFDEFRTKFPQAIRPDLISLGFGTAPAAPSGT